MGEPGRTGAGATSAGPAPYVGETPEAHAFRRVVSRFASGVTVATTVAGGLDHAMTASAFCSVSLDPLLVLLCVEREARFHDAVAESGFWGVSVLREDMRPAATWFAERGRPLHGQLERVAFHRGPRTGTPLLDGALATIECRTEELHGAGDHTIVVGRVLGLDLPDPEGAPLVWYRGRYTSVAPR